MDPQEHNRRRAEMAKDIVALTGCDHDAALLASGLYLTFPDAPDHGFGGVDAWSGAAARTALKTYLAAKVEADAHRVAA
jgi:hypothetical protein